MVKWGRRWVITWLVWGAAFCGGIGVGIVWQAINGDGATAAAMVVGGTLFCTLWPMAMLREWRDEKQTARRDWQGWREDEGAYY